MVSDRFLCFLQERIKWYLSENYIVHILSDDPKELSALTAEFSMQMEQTPPLVTVGHMWGGMLPSTSVGSADEMMDRPRPTRMTTPEHFVQEAVLMAKTHSFTGTTGSTVSQLVHGLRRSMDVDNSTRDRKQTIGQWTFGDQPTTAARSAIGKLSSMVATYTINPADLQLTPQQLQLLMSIQEDMLQEVDSALWEGLQANITNSGQLANKVYERLPNLKTQYRTPYNQLRTTKVGEAKVKEKHFFVALLEYRLNPMRLRDGFPEFWVIEDNTLSLRCNTPPGESNVPAVMIGDTEQVHEPEFEECQPGGEPLQSMWRLTKRPRLEGPPSWKVEKDNLQTLALSKAAPERPQECGTMYLQAKPKYAPVFASGTSSSSGNK